MLAFSLLFGSLDLEKGYFLFLKKSGIWQYSETVKVEESLKMI